MQERIISRIGWQGTSQKLTLPRHLEWIIYLWSLWMEYCAVTITLRAEVSLLHGFSLYVYEVVSFARPLQQCFHLILLSFNSFQFQSRKFVKFWLWPSEGSKHLCVYVSQSVQSLLSGLNLEEKVRAFPWDKENCPSKRSVFLKRSGFDCSSKRGSGEQYFETWTILRSKWK